jgi:hypothetical protein
VDGHLDLDPEAEERRKRKQPVGAAEASPELRSDRGLRRRGTLPRFLGLGAVAGEGVGEGEALLVRDVEDGLGMAAAVGRRSGEGGAGGRTEWGQGGNGIGVWTDRTRMASRWRGLAVIEICVCQPSRRRKHSISVTAIGPTTTPEIIVRFNFTLFRGSFLNK